MQLQQCGAAGHAAGPVDTEHRQVLSIRNTGRACQPLRERLDLLLAPCAALRELYVQQLDISDAACLDLPVIATSCPALRVLVLHVRTQDFQKVSSAWFAGALYLLSITAFRACMEHAHVSHSPADGQHYFAARLSDISDVRRPRHLAKERVSCPVLRVLISIPDLESDQLMLRYCAQTCCKLYRTARNQHNWQAITAAK